MRHFAAICAAMGDDFCLRENILALQARNVDPIYVVSPTRYWATGEAQEPEALEELQALRRDCGICLIRAALHQTQPLRAEAEALNLALQVAEAREADHVLTFDADELWLPGALQQIDDALNEGAMALAGRFLPVVGIPGYPMEGYRSLDRVYTPLNARYTVGRVCPGPTKAGTSQVIHFVGTRRTEHCLYRRYLRSTNYRQGDCAGLARKMSAQKPGAPSPVEGQPWFPLREWTHEEWRLLPESLKPYLAEPSNRSTVQPSNRSTNPEERPCNA